jgi:hypothetical protein
VVAEERSQEPLFAGVDAPNTTPMPDVYFDVLMPRLGKASLKVLLYLIRRIFGFKKDGDTVSLSQICAGIRKRDGTLLDRGTGLSRHAATKAIRDLEELGVITAIRGVSAKGDPAPTFYRLRFREPLSVHDLLRPQAAAPGYRFPGIDSPNTTPVPDVYFDLLLPDLGLAEWRVLLYVIRRTLGFKKLSDAISLDQFTSGITTHEGTVLDGGTGLSRSNVHEALNQLVMRNVLVRQRVRHEQTGDGVSIYSLTMRDEVRQLMGSTLGMKPGPLREGTTNAPVLPGVLQRDRGGVLPDDRLGVPQSDHQGVLQNAHPGIPQTTYPIEPSVRAVERGGLRTTYPRVPQMNRPGSRQDPYPRTGKRPPAGAEQTPQQTESQQTAIQKEIETEEVNPYRALLDQIGADLGVAMDVDLYAGRVAALAQSCGLAAADFYSAIAVAWKTTRRKREQGALDRPNAGPAYFLTVLTDRVSGSGPAPTAPERSPAALQDGRFLEQARQRLGQLGDQTAWSIILGSLAGSMTRANYTRWFARSVAVDDGTELVIVVADPLQRDWLTQRLGDMVRREVQAAGDPRDLRFVALQDLSLS